MYHVFPRFLQDQNSSAFKFYRKKVFELCPSICFASPSLNLHASESTLESVEREGEFANEPPHQEVELESLEVMPEDEEEEEEEEEDEEDEEEEEALTPGGSSRPSGGAATSEGSEGSPPTDGLPSEAAEDGPAGTSALSQACFPRKRVSSKSLKVGMIPAPKRLCLIQEPKGECEHRPRALHSLLLST